MYATLRCTTLSILLMSPSLAIKYPPVSPPPEGEWCALPKNPFGRVCFKTLCMIAISKSSVEHWEALRINAQMSRYAEELKQNAEALKRNLSIHNAEELKRNAEELKRHAEALKWNAEELKWNAEELKQKSIENAEKLKQKAEELRQTSILNVEELKQKVEELKQESIQHAEELQRNSTEEKWEKHKKMVINRFENMNVTAGLVLTSSAVFISTNPPIQTLIPYANVRSYILEVFSFVAALISLMIGTSVLIIYDTCYAHEEILESFKQSRCRLISCLILMAFPSLALVVSTLALMIAVFIAGFTSDEHFVKFLTGGICVIVFLLAALAIYVFNPRIQEAAHRKVDSTGSHEPLSSELTVHNSRV
ncbi:hypothetical protein EDB19DRAFT_542036 [Suillus lakei]|nr:hypothetical protein EDB19DRAFT_542036 [Suillus lakei]